MSERKPVTDKPSGVFHGRRLAHDIINRVTVGGGFANVLLANMPDEPGITADDRRAASNLVYGVLRNTILLDEILRSKSSKGKLTLRAKLLNIARMAVFEIVFMHDIPGYASVSEYMKMARKFGGKDECGFLNACLRKVDQSDLDKICDRKKDEVKRISLRYSHPEWLTRDLVKQYGMERTVNILKTSNKPQPTYFRMNTTRITTHDIMAKFELNRISMEETDAPPACLAMPHGSGPFPSAEYDAGWITPQDRSTQFIPYLLSPSPGDTILDLCCGSGIKTTQMSEICNGECNITAVDNIQHKLDSLAAECNRLGAQGVTPVCADITTGPELGLFDKVLLDAPCSGTGVLRRRPEIRWRVTRASIKKLAGLQDTLLDAASGYVRPGGILVYATCSLLKAENEDRIHSFIHRHSEFSVMGLDSIPGLTFSGESFHVDARGITFTPNRINACGAFAAVMKKSG